MSMQSGFGRGHYRQARVQRFEARNNEASKIAKKRKRKTARASRMKHRK